MLHTFRTKDVSKKKTNILASISLPGNVIFDFTYRVFEWADLGLIFCFISFVFKSQFNYTLKA